MKPIFSTVAAAALAIGLSSAASAEPFNGAYVGAQAGWTQHDVGTSSTRLGDVAVGRSRDSVSGGVFAGYDVKLSPRFVVGAQAGLEFGIDDRIRRDTGTALVTVDPRRSIDLTARAGYLVGDNTLLYARGGYANARIRTTIDDGAGLRSTTGNRDGWLVGGGLEHALGDNVSARVEYRYSDLGKSGAGHDRHQALFGIAYRF